MQNDAALSVLSRDELEQLVSIYAKNWLAMDGYWFQAVERKRGMDEAMEHDVAVWQGFTRTEARRIRALLRLPEQAGLDGLEKALAYRMYARINRDEIIREGDDALVYRTLECYVQRARAEKGMPYHPWQGGRPCGICRLCQRDRPAHPLRLRELLPGCDG